MLVGEQLPCLVHNYLRRGGTALPSIWGNQLVLGLQNSLISKTPRLCRYVVIVGYSNILQREEKRKKHLVRDGEEDGESCDGNSLWDLHPSEFQLAWRVWEQFCIVGFHIGEAVLWSKLTTWLAAFWLCDMNVLGVLTDYLRCVCSQVSNSSVINN